MSPGRPARSDTPAPPDPLARLFDGSGLVGLTDGELLARFAATGDEAAFEGLVVRLGPMVLGVARRMLGDRADADDAFQATFLVLVRRARAVGRGDLIGPWLHGVAVRVCRKARAQASRRRARERTGAAVDILPVAGGDAGADPLAGSEVRSAIDDAIARLPEGCRRLVILCDVEGLSRAEAADRLGWTPNMVRGRLARARAQLRAALIRRGCVPAGLPGSTAGAANPDLGLAVLLGMAPPSSALIATTARAALVLNSPSGRTAAAALASTTALHLADGVLRTMFLTSWKFVGPGLIAGGACVAETAGVLLAQGPAPANLPAAPQAASSSPPAADPPGPVPPPIDPNLIDPNLMDEMVQGARRNYAAEKTLYDAGKSTVHALLGADLSLMGAEVAISRLPKGRQAAVAAHQARVRRVQEDQVKRAAEGKATPDDVSESTEALHEAEILLAHEMGLTADGKSDASPAGTLRALLKERRRAALIRYDAQIAFYEEGRITIDRLIDASRQLMQADLALATTPAERRLALNTYVNQLQRDHNREVAELAVGRATSADVAEVADSLLEAKILLAQAANEPAPTQVNPAAPAEPTPVVSDATSRQVAEWRQRRVELARGAFEIAKDLYTHARVEFSEYRQAMSDRAEAELAAAPTPAARSAALQALVAAAEQAVAETRKMHEAARTTELTVNQARMALLDAQIRAAQDGKGADVDRRLTDLERKLDRVLDFLDRIPNQAPARR